MSNHYFQFKQFIIHQDKCSMKVGTDGVLLGAWCNVLGAQKILDIGTGTGLISLMLAQKSNAVIHAIDYDESSFKQASDNFKTSKWNNRLFAINTSLQNFQGETAFYDLIVSNPPYFSNSFKSDNNSRNMARHTDSLPFEVLISETNRLLSSDGSFNVIIPFESGDFFINSCSLKNLHLSRYTEIIPLPEKPAKRLLLEFSRKEVIDIPRNVLIIETGIRHIYTNDYMELTKDYYLNF